MAFTTTQHLIKTEGFAVTDDNSSFYPVWRSIQKSIAPLEFILLIHEHPFALDWSDELTANHSLLAYL